MTSLALLREHTRVAFLDNIRWPTYIVTTLLFPSMFFILFDLQTARTSSALAGYLTLSFMAWAVVGVTLYTFGVDIAQERGRPWERYLRTLPVSTGVRFSARVLAAIAFAAVAATCVALIAQLSTPIDLTLLQWLRVGFSMLCAGVPFVLAGITIGYWVSAKAAVPIATASNLLLAYAGGLWMPPRYLPHFVQQISPYLPTRMFGDLLWSAIGGDLPVRAVAGLAIYTIVFAILAVVGYRRDEGKRYA